MFNIKQTRIVFILVIMITFLISYIGVRLKGIKKDEYVNKAILIVPQIKTPGEILKKSKKENYNINLKKIDAKQSEELGSMGLKNHEKDFPGALEDEGKTIILNSE